MKKIFFVYPFCFFQLLVIYSQTVPDTLRFGVMADCQYCNCDPSPFRYYRHSTGKLAACIAELNKHDLDFAVHLGDFIDKDFASFDSLQPIIDQLDTKLHHVLGNHDFSVEEKLKKKVPARMGLKRRYYSFEYGNWQFIVLDGNDLSLYAAPGKRKKRMAEAMLQKAQAVEKASAKDWNGGLSEKQMNWLDRQLERAENKGRKVILLCHFPVYPVDQHNLWNHDSVIGLIEKYSCVKAYFNGHNHAGNYVLQHGIHFLTFKGMVDTPEENAFAVVMITKDRIIVKGYGRQEDLVLDF